MLDKLKRLFSKEEEVIELKHKPEEKPQILVKVHRLDSIADVDAIERDVKSGHIAFVKAKDIQRRDFAEFQASIQKIQRLARNYGWDVVGVEEGYIIIAPRNARIVRD